MYGIYEQSPLKNLIFINKQNHKVPLQIVFNFFSAVVRIFSFTFIATVVLCLNVYADNVGCAFSSFPHFLLFTSSCKHTFRKKIIIACSGLAVDVCLDIKSCVIKFSMLQTLCMIMEMNIIFSKKNSEHDKIKFGVFWMTFFSCLDVAGGILVLKFDDFKM